jgi:hypothetical protein
MSDILVANYYGLAEISNSIAINGTVSARTNGWLSKAWRIVRSVVVTVVAVALVTAAVVGAVVASAGTATPIIIAAAATWAGYVGAVVGAVWGVTSAMNDTCYYAGQCSVKSAGSESCSTGVCMY